MVLKMNTIYYILDIYIYIYLFILGVERSNGRLLQSVTYIHEPSYISLLVVPELSIYYKHSSILTIIIVDLG